MKLCVKIVYNYFFFISIIKKNKQIILLKHFRTNITFKAFQD